MKHVVISDVSVAGVAFSILLRIVRGETASVPVPGDKNRPFQYPLTDRAG